MPKWRWSHSNPFGTVRKNRCTCLNGLIIKVFHNPNFKKMFKLVQTGLNWIATNAVLLQNSKFYFFKIQLFQLFHVSCYDSLWFMLNTKTASNGTKIIFVKITINPQILIISWLIQVPSDWISNKLRLIFFWLLTSNDLKMISEIIMSSKWISTIGGPPMGGPNGTENFFVF